MRRDGLQRMATSTPGQVELRRCARCHEVIVRVPDVGWVVDDPDGSYDMCEGDRFANHEPLPGPVTTPVGG